MRSVRFVLRNFSVVFILPAFFLAPRFTQGQRVSSPTVAMKADDVALSSIADAPSAAREKALRTGSSERYEKGPLAFEANAGQADGAVRFFARGRGYGLYLTDHEAVLALRAENCSSRSQARGKPGCSSDAAVVRMALDAAEETSPIPAGEDRQTGTANYFMGNDSSKWRSGVPLFGKVRYSGVYPGVDLVYYGSQQQLEYDFVVAPKADPSRIHLRFDGAKPPQITPDGSLLIAAEGDRKITLQRPVSYQMVDGQRRSVESRFVLLASHAIGFELGAYDHTQPLVIDPVLVYSTYLSGTGRLVLGQEPFNDVLAIATDALGDTYVTGYTFATDFPVSAGALQSQLKGTANIAPSAFVTEFDPNGGLVFSTYFGGSGQYAYQGVSYEGDQANAIAVDATGIYIAGSTYSTDFPVTSGAFQKSLLSSTPLAGCSTSTMPSNVNGFITKLAPSGASLIYSTYLGGTGKQVKFSNSNGTACGDQGDEIHAMAVDAAGDVFVAGSAQSSDFPVTSGSFQSTDHNTQPVTSIGAAEHDFLLSNGFITKMNPAGSALLYSTYLGGSSGDSIQALKIDAAGDAFVAGNANSTDFPITPGVYQTTLNPPNASGTSTTVFATKLNAAGSALLYSTFLGAVGNNSAGNLALAVDATGDVYVGGGNTTVAIPATPGAFQPGNRAASGGGNGVLLKLSSDGTSVPYATYLGGSLGDGINALALDAAGDIFIASDASSVDFPTTANALQPSNNGSACNAATSSNYNGALTELNPTGSTLLYSTYLGGSDSDGFYSYNGDTINAMALDSIGRVYLGGHSYSSNFPVTYNGYQKTPNLPYQSGGVIGSGYSGFVSKLDLTSTSITPTVTVSPATFGGGASPQNVTATVSSSVGGKPVPTGSLLLEVTSYVGSVYQASATLNNGQAQFTIPANTLTSASYCLIGSYTPDQNSSTLYNPGEGQGTAAATTSVTVTTQPADLSITVDGQSYTAPQTFSWNVGDTHTIATTSPQTASGTMNTFSDWTDGGALSHTITVSGANSYTAHFTTSYQLTESANPAAGGTVQPASGSFYSPGTMAPVHAIPNAGYTFSGWTGPVASSTSALTTVTMNAPESVTANFTATGTQSAAVMLSNLNQTYTGSPLAATATTTPSGLTVAITYNGSATPPTAAGSYSVVATVTSSGYAGSATGTLLIAKASASVTLSNLTQTYTGSPLSISAATTPVGLMTTITYNGSATQPTAVGAYSVVATINDPNYMGSATGTFTIAAVPVPTFTLSASGPQTLASGGSSQFTITATAMNGAFSNPVALTVTGLPSGATASFSPASITPGAASATSTLTINLPQTVSMSTRSARGWSFAVLGLPLWGMFVLRRRASLSKWKPLTLAVLVFFLSAGLLTGCGQNGFNYSTSSSQTYAITITGTSGATTATTTAQLTVTTPVK